MKYFTVEELDYIAKELLENPSKETLKKLNDKYNGEEISTNNLNWVESPIQNSTENTSQILNLQETNNQSVSSFSIPVNENNNVQVEAPIKEEVEVVPKFEEEKELKAPVWNPTGNTNDTLFNASVSIPNVQLQSNNVDNKAFEEPTMPDLNIQETSQNNSISFELPKIDSTTSMNIPSLEPNTNNGQIPFNGNLWENQNTGINNMMQTTDNFNTPIEQVPSNPVNQEPFFPTNMSPVNNPLPISEPPKVEGPTMFGQFEQNFNNNAA